MLLKNCRRKTSALLFIAALLNFYSTSLLAAPVAKGALNPSGELTAMGLVRVDGVLMMSGTTVLSGSTIRAEEKSGAIISLGQLGRMELSPGAILRLDFDGAGFMGQLETGRLRVSLPPKAYGSILTGDGLVVAHHEEAALFTVEVKEGRTLVAVRAGQIELRKGERTRQIAAGQEASAGMSVNDLPASASVPRNSQNLSGGKLTGLVVAISGALTAIALIVTLHHQEEQPPQETSGCCIADPSPSK
jgi:hypothetical protein